MSFAHQLSEVKVTPFSPLGGRIIEIKRGVDSHGAYLSEEQCKTEEEKVLF